MVQENFQHFTKKTITNKMEYELTRLEWKNRTSKKDQNTRIPTVYQSMYSIASKYVKLLSKN